MLHTCVNMKYTNSKQKQVHSTLFIKKNIKKESHYPLKSAVVLEIQYCMTKGTGSYIKCLTCASVTIIVKKLQRSYNKQTKQSLYIPL